MKIIERSSPNNNSRDGHIIDMLVMHYTNMKTAEEALERLCDPSAQVSAHYLIAEDGTVHALVPEEMRAWHAGVSHWRGSSNINQRSIGIELANPGHKWGYKPFPPAQMESLITLCKQILSRHAIPARNVVGHSDICPNREDKMDPGVLFDWPLMAKNGIGLWPSSAGDALASDLSRYGYETTNLPNAITAFQRHFRRNLLNGIWDEECAGLLAALLEMI